MTKIKTKDAAKATIGAAAVVLSLGLSVALPGSASANVASCTVPNPEEISDDDAQALYDCIIAVMQEHRTTLEAGGEIEGPSWLLSDAPEAQAFLDYESVARVPYESGTHGGRYVYNLADPVAMPSYSQYEAGSPMPVGGILAKPSFVVSDTGEARLGPLFLMERAEDGAYPEMGDWIYSAIMPNGSVLGPTGGPNHGRVQFCADCHLGMGAETDSMTYVPEEYRIAN
ncbi:MAG: hypothetical protein COW55_14295 [Rhodobacteraceae bacterium CG17_big_fil_post_rev_8_21_14_2_50_65_11]|nr:MAG: hypothetical protein COW55_14295 [Rhodobacteraceae bacterium CG17_big_fil_post_rev_8_21_14_2_50_65_11]